MEMETNIENACSKGAVQQSNWGVLCTCSNIGCYNTFNTFHIRITFFSFMIKAQDKKIDLGLGFSMGPLLNCHVGCAYILVHYECFWSFTRLATLSHPQISAPNKHPKWLSRFCQELGKMKCDLIWISGHTGCSDGLLGKSGPCLCA